jgi:hypothetical protein
MGLIGDLDTRAAPVTRFARRFLVNELKTEISSFLR